MDEVEKRKQKIEDTLSVAAFIAWQDPGEIYGGVKREEAFEAFCRLMGLDPWTLDKIIKGQA